MNVRAYIILLLIAVAFYPLLDSQRAAAQPPVGADSVPHRFLGKVVAITKEGVTIKPEGDLKIPEITFDKNGTEKVERVYVQDNKQPPKTFQFTDSILFDSGLKAVANGASTPPSGHLITDLRLGDSILISCGRVKGTDYCRNIEITDRPGGKVPLRVEEKKK